MDPQSQDKDLLAIEELSQKLQNLFKEMEHIRRENLLFQSYYIRMKTQGRNQQEPDQSKGKKQSKSNKLQKKHLQLTPQQKYEIATLQSQKLRQNINQGRSKSDGMIETLRAILQQTDMAIAQIRKDAYDFQRQVLLGGENSRTGKIEAQRIQKYFVEKEREKQNLIQKFINKSKTLVQSISKTQTQIAKKLQMGDELKYIDYHQLQIQNKKYIKEIRQKNDKMTSLKLTAGQIAIELLESKKKLLQQQQSIEKTTRQIQQKIDAIKKADQQLKILKQQKDKKFLQKKKLESQADQMKNNSGSIPDTMAYVLQKKTENELIYKKKNLQRKINIARGVYQKSKKQLGIRQ